MTQKFYLRNLTATSPPTAGEKSTVLPVDTLGANNASGAEETRSLNAVAGISQTSISKTSDATTSARDNYLGRFASVALQAGTYGSGSWTIALALSSASLLANSFTSCSIYFWRPSTEAVVGFVYDSDANIGSEWDNTEEGRVASITGANVTIQDGDVLVIEIWRHAVQAMATAYAQTLYFDGATDPTNGTQTTDAASYINAPADIPEVPLITPQLVTDSVAITQSPKVGKSIPITQSFSNGESIIRDKNFVMSQAFAGSNLILLSKGTIIPDNISTVDKIIKSAGHIIPLSIIAAVGIFKGLNLIISQSGNFVDLIKREKHITLQDTFANSEFAVMSKQILVPDSVVSTQSVIAGKSLLVLDSISNGIQNIASKILTLPDSVSLTEAMFLSKTKKISDALTAAEIKLIAKYLVISDSLSDAENITIEKFLKLLDSIITAETFLLQKTLLVSNSLTAAENVLAGKILKLLDSIVISSQSLVGKSFLIPDSLSITSNIIRIKILNLQDTMTFSSVLNVIKSFKITDVLVSSEILKAVKDFFIPQGINTNRIISSPIQDISNVGGWVDSENGNNNGILFDELDEIIPDDDISAISLLKVPAITDTFEVKLATITPGQNSGIKIKIRGRGDGDTKVRGILLEGVTVIAITPYHTLSTEYDSFEYELTEAEASSITDYANLRIRIEPDVI